jgi:hypothetical protein
MSLCSSGIRSNPRMRFGPSCRSPEVCERAVIRFLPFPVGRFSEREWRAAYRFSLDEADAAREAAWNAAVTADQAEHVGISEVDLAYLSLVSADLAERVEAFRRDSLANHDVPLDDVGLAERREKEWEELRAHLRRGL